MSYNFVADSFHIKKLCSSSSSSSSSVVIYTQSLGAGISTKQIRLQLPTESFDCDVTPSRLSSSEVRF